MLRSHGPLAPLILPLTILMTMLTPCAAQAPSYRSLPLTHIGVTGERTVFGTAVRIVGPVIFRKNPVEVMATATYEDDNGRVYTAESNKITLNIPVVEAWLSVYEDGKLAYTVKLTNEIYKKQ